MSQQWCWKYCIDLCGILQIGDKNFFLYETFSTNQISRKNQIQLFDCFVIGIERWVNSDAEKILLTFVVFSESVRKNFCLNTNFSSNQNSRGNQIEFFHFFTIGIDGWVNIDAWKILLTCVFSFILIFCRNIFRWMKILQIWIIRFFEFWNREINVYGYW